MSAPWTGPPQRATFFGMDHTSLGPPLPPQPGNTAPLACDPENLPEELTLDVGLRMLVRRWPGGAPNFVLLHGLASNARTWDLVARHLCAAGHAVAAPDLRGHGRSEKPPSGYDAATVAADVARLLDGLGWERPLVVGQSWGGNVVLELGARHPGRVRGLGLVDGGWIDLRSRPGGSWEEVARELRPPNLLGTAWDTLRERLRAAHPRWSGEAVDAAMGCFERLPDGTVRPWLTLDRHLAILRGLWEQRPAELYARVREPVVLCVAEDGSREAGVRERQVEAAVHGLGRAAVHRFPGAHHDLHLDQPSLLAKTLLDELRAGIWADGG